MHYKFALDFGTLSTSAVGEVPLGLEREHGQGKGDSTRDADRYQHSVNLTSILFMEQYSSENHFVCQSSVSQSVCKTVSAQHS